MHLFSLRHLARVLLLVATCAAIGVVGAGTATGQATEVQLTGNNANNFVTIRAVDATTLEICTDLLGCASYARTNVQRIVFDGQDGDDGIFINHGTSFVNHPTVPLNVIFDGGVGSDELRICTNVNCTQQMTTDVSVLPDTNEIRVVQCLGATTSGARCVDEPFQQPVPTLKINAVGVDVVTDMSPGPANIIGTGADDAVTIDTGESFRNTADGIVQPTGRVSIGTIAAVQVMNKANVTVDTGGGADRVVVDAIRNDLAGQPFHGLAATTTQCATDGVAGAALCLRLGPDLGDAVEVTPGAGAEPVVLATRPSDLARLSGLARIPVLDLAGADALAVPVQPGEGDSFTVQGSPLADGFRWGATAPDVLTVGGDLAVTSTAPAPIPDVTLRGDGTGPIRAVIDPLGGADRIDMAAGPAADVLTMAPLLVGVDVVHDLDGRPHSRVTAAAEEVLLATGDGADVLSTRGATTTGADGTVRAVGPLATAVTWQAGPGADRLDHLGDGTPVSADLGSGLVAPVGASVGLTVTEAEVWAVDAAGDGLLVTGTSGADVVRYAPVDGRSARISIDGHPTAIDATGVAGTMSLEAAGGDDRVAVLGTTGNDTFAIGRGDRTTVQIGDLLPVRALEGTEAVHLDGGTGDDRFLVTGEGGAPALSVVGGGHGASGDRLSVAAVPADAQVAFDAAPAAGTVTAGGPPIAFEGLEHVDVEGSGDGALRVLGSDAPDVIAQQGGTVTVGRGTTAAFTRFAVLALDGLAGDDEVHVTPRTLTGVTRVDVDGGTGADTLAVTTSSLRETIAYRPEGPAAGRVEVSLAPPTAFAGVDAVEVDGATSAPSGDTLLVRSPAVAGTVVVAPGTAVDQASITLADATGPVAAVPPLHVGGLGRGGIVVDGADSAGAPADLVRVLGEPDADVFVVTASDGASSTVVDSRIPVTTTAVTALQLHGLDGHDLFRLPAAPGLPGAGGPAVTVDGGGPTGAGPAGGDVAVVTGSGADLVTDLAAGTVTEVGQRPVSLQALDRIDLLAGGAPVLAVGGPGPDAVSVRPTGPAAAQLSSDLVTARVDVAGAAGLRIDTADGADTLSVLGSAAPEEIAITRGDVPLIRVGDRLPVTATAAVEAIAVDGAAGADLLVIDGEGGPASLAVDGGAPPADGDVIRLLAPSAVVAFDDPATSGVLGSPGGSLAFAGADVVDVVGDGSGELVVRGTDAPDVMTLGDPGTPAVRVDRGAAVTYAGYPTLVLDGRGAGDQIVIGYANPGDVSGIRAVGGSALDDVVRIVDGLGTTRSWAVAPTDADRALVTASGGAPAVEVSGAAELQLVGRGAGDVLAVRTPLGAQEVVLTPGAGVGDGRARVGSLLPVAFTDLGAAGRLVVGAPGAADEDRVVVEGTAAADTIRVVGPDRLVTRVGWVPAEVHGTAALVVRAGDGADALHATGPLPWPEVVLDGGAPDNGDGVTLDGPVGDTVVDLANATITGYGGTVRVPEVERLETRHGTQGLTLLGTASDDGMCIDPLSPRDGRLHLLASPGGGLLSDSCQPATGSVALIHTFTDVGALLVDPGAGSDQVLVNGTVEDDAVILESTGERVDVTVHPNPAGTEGVRLPVSILSATTEQVIVATDGGVDDLDLRIAEASAPRLVVHGELPDTRKADHLTVRDISGGANIGNTGSATPGSGTVEVEWRRFSGAVVQIDYTGIEEVKIFKTQRPRGT